MPMPQSKPKGVILAAGRGVRLKPLTDVTNKMLLPVFDRPMIVEPIETMKKLGISEICLVTSEHHLDAFKKFLGNGSALGVNLSYAIQKGHNGIVGALLQAEDFCAGSKVVLLFGDNLFEKPEIPMSAFTDDEAYIFIKEVNDPERFGVAEIKNDKVVNIEEKPANPKTNFAVIGFYIYPNDVFEVSKTLTPSARGELEITDVNNHYIQKNKLKAIKISSYWFDTGTLDSLLRASILRAISVSPSILKGIDREELIRILTDT